MSDVRSRIALTEALDKLLDSLPPDFPNRAYYDETTALHGMREVPGERQFLGVAEGHPGFLAQETSE